MKQVLALALISLFFFGCASQTQTGQVVATNTAEDYYAQAFFCPEDSCAQKVIDEISLAQSSIDVAIYSFTLDSIADSLLEAKARGVKVRIIMDRLQAASDYSEDERLESNGIEVKISSKTSGIMHNKFLVVDNKLVLTGSFNYSRNADEFNDENLVLIGKKEIVQGFLEEFEELWKEN